MLEAIALISGILLLTFGVHTAYIKRGPVVQDATDLRRYRHLLVGTGYAIAGVLLLYSSTLLVESQLAVSLLAALIVLAAQRLSTWLSRADARKAHN